MGSKRVLAGAAAIAALAAWPGSAAAHGEGDEAIFAKPVVRAAGPEDPSKTGVFGQPFREPTISGQTTNEDCIQRKEQGQVGAFDCKPAAGSVNTLPDGRVLYWNALEGTENIKTSIVSEFGYVTVNDQSRLLKLSGGKPTWAQPSPVDGGANPNGYDNEPTFEPPASTTETYNDGALFCSDQTFLPDGRIIASGGTAYYDDPAPGPFGDPALQAMSGGLGIVELEGLRNSRIFNPETNRWSQSGDMTRGRWYPTMVGLGAKGRGSDRSGQVFIASGVQKLLKPIYPGNPKDTGRNNVETETYHPKVRDPATGRMGRWTYNGEQADRTLPLFPRLHLLPNGDVFFNVAGQSFNPFGQAYDQASWNVAATYDPATKRWTDLGIPGLPSGANSDDPALQPPPPSGPPGSSGTPDVPFFPDYPRGAVAGGTGPGGINDITALVQDPSQVGPPDRGRGFFPGGGKNFVYPGFRGSTFSIQMPLKADSRGRYTQASYLTAGGVLNPPSPGSYFPTDDSRMTTVDVSRPGRTTMRTTGTGDLNTPRWYGSGELLPTGEVVVFNGADRDEVVTPGLEYAVPQAELFDPETQTWRPIATSNRERTYHNTATLLRDGRVLIGGHATISTLYTKNLSLPGGRAPNGHDPSFEVFSPPYLFRGRRPRITQAKNCMGYGGNATVTTDFAASDIESVVLVRNNSQTHLVDGDQRNVELRIVARKGKTLTLARPPDANVAPEGPYQLFVNRKSAKGLIPSNARQVTVTPACKPARAAGTRGGTGRSPNFTG